MIEIVIISLCLVLNAVLAGAETAFIAVSRPTLAELAKKGNTQAAILLQLRENPEKTLSVIQVGITFVGALAAAFGGAGAEEIIAPWLVHTFALGEVVSEVLSILLIVVPLTYLSVVFGELVPKIFALRRPLFFASKIALFLQRLINLLYPLVVTFEWSTKKTVNFLSKSGTTQESEIPNELATDLEILSPRNKQYVINIVKIEKMTASSIMINWSEVGFLENRYSVAEVEAKIISCGHTRLPVLENGQVIGLLNAKEFLAFQKTGRDDWLSLVRPALKISHETFLLAALQTLQEKRAHLAIVYKGVTKVGIITMEAIFEEIIGDIYDEDDDGTLKQMLNSIHFKKR